MQRMKRRLRALPWIMLGPDVLADLAPKGDHDPEQFFPNDD